MKKSDTAAVLMLNRYIQGMVDTASEAHEGRAVLEPVLECGYTLSMHLTFRVGQRRMYVVSDLNIFKTRFEGHLEYSYGKQLTLYHGLASFCAESRPIVDFFLKNYDDNNGIHNPDRSYRYYYNYSSNKLSIIAPDDRAAFTVNKRVVHLV